MGCLSIVSLAGCATTEAALVQEVPLAEQRVALADLAVEAKTDSSPVALVTALSEITLEGRSYAFAPDVDISQPVRRSNPALTPAERLVSVLSSASLQARDVGTVIFIQRAGSNASDVKAPPPALRSAGPSASVPVQLEQRVPPVLEAGISSVPDESAGAAPKPVAMQEPAVMEPPENHSQRDWFLQRSATPEPRQVSAPAESEQILAQASPPSQGEPVTLSVPESPAKAVVGDSAPIATPPAPAVTAAPKAPESVAVAPAAGSVTVVPDVVQTVVATVSAETSLNGNMGTDAHPQVAASGTWMAQRGETLRSTLQRWSEREGVQLVWRTEYDYPLATSLAVPGNYEGAVRVLLSGFANAAPQPYGQLHRQGGTGSKVLVVTSRGNDYAE